MLGLHFLETVPEIIRIAIEKAFSLNEVEEHQPIQHYRGVPFVVALVWNAGDEFEKGRVLFPELFVETFRDAFVDVAGGAACDIWQGQALFFVERDEETFEFLDEELA